MEIKLIKNEKPIELDEFLDEDEMEMTPFHYSLIELSQYINGSINIIFKGELNIKLDLFSDFSVCLDDIIDSINAAKSYYYYKEKIWFCEQGSDFYLHYEVNNEMIILSYKKGRSVGMSNIDMDDFIVEVSKSEYIQKWTTIFQELCTTFENILHKKIDVPF